MPAANLWASFFNVELILTELQINRDIQDWLRLAAVMEHLPSLLQR